MKEKNILWLVSWYPNEKDPYAGDFIQRHAQAVSRFRKLTVFYMDQLGWQKSSANEKTTVLTNENLIEVRHYFAFNKTGIPFIDRLFYNLKYHLKYRQLLKKVFQEYGFPDLIHVHVPMKSGKLALWVKRKWGIPFILSEQASTYLELAPDNFEKRSSYYRNSVKKIFKEAIAVTNVSKTVAGILEKKMGLDYIEVIHNTVNEQVFFYKSEIKPKFRFIHVSALNEQKNILGLLNAFYSFSSIRNDWELRLVGPVSTELQEKLDLLKKEMSISWTGEIAYNEVAKEMQQASAFVLFSNHENFPCVIVEALACGLPVITSDAGGAGESINNFNGKVVPVGNEQKLLLALNDVMDQYHLYNKSKIAEKAISIFSYPVVGMQFSRLYDKIFDGNASL